MNIFIIPGMGCLICFNSLSKQVAMSSMQIQTSESVMKQPRQRTILKVEQATID
jgi:hypothetical protein